MVPSGCTAYVESVPLAKPFVLVALVALAVAVCVMVGSALGFQAPSEPGMAAAPLAKVVCGGGHSDRWNGKCDACRHGATEQ